MASPGPGGDSRMRDVNLGLAQIAAVTMPERVLLAPKPKAGSTWSRRGDLSEATFSPTPSGLSEDSACISNPFARSSIIQILDSLSDCIRWESDRYFNTPLASLFSNGFYLCPVANSQKEGQKLERLDLSAQTLSILFSDRKWVASLEAYSQKDSSFKDHIASLQYFVSVTLENRRSSEQRLADSNPRLREFLKAGQFLHEFFSLRKQLFESEMLGLVGLMGKSGELAGSSKALKLYEEFAWVFTERKAGKSFDKNLELARGLLEKKYSDYSALSDDLGRDLFRLHLMEELAERNAAFLLCAQIRKEIKELFESMNERAKSQEAGFDSGKALYLREILVDAVDADLLVSHFVLTGLSTNDREMRRVIIARENSFAKFRKEFNAHFEGIREFEWVEPVAVTDKSLYDLR